MSPAARRYDLHHCVIYGRLAVATRPAPLSLSRLHFDWMSFHQLFGSGQRDIKPTVDTHPPFLSSSYIHTRTHTHTHTYIYIYINTLADFHFSSCLFSGSVLLTKAEDDEIITIVCKQDAASSLTLLTSKRSALQRSPMLAEFFRSTDYLVGSGTQLEFHGTSVACLRVIKEYLEDGPDLYTEDTLRSYAIQETGTRKVYDFLLVVSVHKLAVKLGLNSLMHLAYAVLYHLECSVTPRDCINLIGLVFNTNHHFNNALQNWFLEQVDRHFDSLSGSCEWANAMVKSSTEFKVLWADVTLTHLRPSPTTRTTGEDTKASLPTFMKPLPAAPAIIVTDSTSEATVLDDSSEDDYYEPQDYARGRSDRELAKARRVLGIDDDGGGIVVGRVDKKKPSGLSRASKSLMGLMKRD